MSFPISYQAEVFSFVSRKGRRFGAIALLLFLISCGSEEIPEFKSAPDLWEGNQSGFELGFSFRSIGNESVLHYEDSGRPFSGAIERNSSDVLTRQTFSSGKLNGLSSKRSKDGSWVEATYRDGLLHGAMTFYSADGSIRSVINFKEGRLFENARNSLSGEANASSF
ncbi:MAG: hypothetical protein CMI29_03825 [Opitutae bacterium]|nr:hypothetical protein [Opitutae bacterium]|tara:strand:- start:14301 stop:14801 length:501 start_codon:yes stop_codon:yes gene_type:complete